MSLLREATETILKRGESMSADPASFHASYDQFVWVALTSTRDELREVFNLFRDVPYINLPVPLQVLIARLVGHAYPEDPATKEATMVWIAMYCDPIEERNATEEIRRGAAQERPGDSHTPH